MRRRTGLLLAALMVAPLAGCGGSADTGASGAPIVNWYIGNESWLPDVIEACNAQADGAYELQAESLPTNPDSQREQLVRRLAAKDSSIDLIGMDVVWTGEFAQAGWITPFAAGRAGERRREDQVLKGPCDSAQYRRQAVRRAAEQQHPAALVPQEHARRQPGAADLGPAARHRRADGRQDPGDRQAGRVAGGASSTRSRRAPAAPSSRPATTARPRSTCPRGPDGQGAGDHEALRDVQRRPAALSTSAEDDNRLAFQSADSDSAFMINWPYVYPSALEADPALAEDYGVAAATRGSTAGTPAKAPLGGYNLGIGAFTNNRDAALAAINCLTEPDAAAHDRHHRRPAVGAAGARRRRGDQGEAAVPAAHDRAARERRAAPGDARTTTTSRWRSGRSCTRSSSIDPEKTYDGAARPDRARPRSPRRCCR